MFDQLLFLHKEKFAVQCLHPKRLIFGIVASHSWIYVCPHMPQS
jgi:hypothetical protein